MNRDDVVVVEVMVDQLDREWWHHYREVLEERFQQQEIIVRAISMEKL